MNLYIEKSFKADNCAKSAAKSAEKRKIGNELYKAKKLVGAVCNYSRAIIYAECNSSELSLAYANRSAALFHKSEWTVFKIKCFIFIDISKCKILNK